MNQLETTLSGRVTRLRLNVLIFQEGDYFVAYCPPLNMSSYGDSIDDAKTGFDEVVQAWLEDAQRNGTLHKDLIQHGWSFDVHVAEPPANIELNIPAGALRRQVNESYSVPVC